MTGTKHTFDSGSDACDQLMLVRKRQPPPAIKEANGAAQPPAEVWKAAVAQHLRIPQLVDRQQACNKTPFESPGEDDSKLWIARPKASSHHL